MTHHFQQRLDPDEPDELRGKPLAPYERRVVAMVALDMSNAEMAAELECSINTIRGYVHMARRKVGVRSRVGLALWAARGNGDV